MEPLPEDAGPQLGPTLLGELREVLLQVRDALPLQVAVKLEPGDGLPFGEPGCGEQPATADHLLQEPAAHWPKGEVVRRNRGSAQPSLGDRTGGGQATYFHLSRVFPSDSVQEHFLELAQESRGGAGQDAAGVRALPP